MRRIGIYNEKGGSGKTTLAVHLALAWPAPLLDLDEQQTASLWLRNRQTPAPILSEMPAPGTRAIIDFAPGKDLARARLLEQVDLVLIPVRPTFNDLATLGNTVRLVKAAGKPAAFVVTMLNLRTSEARDVTQALAPHGFPIWGAITNRVAYSRAGMIGGSADELGDEVAKNEIKYILKRLKNG